MMCWSIILWIAGVIIAGWYSHKMLDDSVEVAKLYVVRTYSEHKIPRRFALRLMIFYMNKRGDDVCKK